MTVTENVLLCKKDMNLDVILNASSIKYETKLKKKMKLQLEVVTLIVNRLA